MSPGLNICSFRVARHDASQKRLAGILGKSVRRRWLWRLEREPEKCLPPDVIRGGYRFSEKHALGLDPRDHAPSKI
jgi:hypothetical protein